jgi:hypothetical protein
MQRYPVIEVMGPVKRVYSNFIYGIRSLPVRIPAREKARSNRLGAAPLRRR